jgi:hypothetical protein
MNAPMNAPGNIDAQIELSLVPARKRGRVTHDMVEDFCALLRFRGWLRAEEILRERPQWPQGDNGKRLLSILAGAAKLRVISYPGSPGYRLTAELSDTDIEQLDHAGNALIHQGRDMARRGIAYKRLAGIKRAAVAQREGGN